MKTTVLFAFVLFSFKTFSQDTVKIREVDSLVKLINNSNFRTQRDTIKQERPEFGLSMQNYLAMMSDDKELKKYVNNVHSIIKENGKTKQMYGGNVFYFDQNKLIKVEEFIKDGDNIMEFSWYYSDEKPIYNTLKTEEEKERAKLLLKMANPMVEGFKSSINATSNTQNQTDEYRTPPYSTDTSKLTKAYIATGFYLLTDKIDGIKMRKAQSDEVYKIASKPFVSVNNILHCSLQIDTTDNRILGSIIMDFDEKGTKDFINVTGNPSYPFIAVVIANRLLYVVENREKMTKGKMTVLLDGYSKEEMQSMVNEVKKKK
jgi:hypothetical protein